MFSHEISLTTEQYQALTKTLMEEFTKAGADMNDPTVQALYQKALEMAVESSKAQLKAKKTCTRDVIIITVVSAAAAAATFFLAPLPEQYKIPATVGCGVIGAAADVMRVMHSRKVIRDAANIEAGSMAAFTAAMGIVGPTPAPAATGEGTNPPVSPTGNEHPKPEPTTENIVNGDAQG